MPTSIIVRSTVLPDRSYTFTRTASQTNKTDANGKFLPTSNSFFRVESTDTVTTDNTLDRSYVGIQTLYHSIDDFTINVHSLVRTDGDAGAGGTVTMTFPTYKASWGQPTFTAWLITGTVVSSAPATASSSPAWAVNPEWVNVPLPSINAQNIGDGASTWRANQPYVSYSCANPAVPLINGREPFFARMRYSVCDSAYNPQCPTTKGFIMAPTDTETFHALSDADRPINTAFNGISDGRRLLGLSGGIFSAGNGYSFLRVWPQYGATKSLALWGTPFPGITEQGTRGAFGSLCEPPGTAPANATPNTVYTTTSVSSITQRYGGLQFILYVEFDGEADVPTPAANYVPMDCYDGIIAACWTGAASNGKKQLYIGTQPALTANIGSGSGSTGGWLPYLYGDIDERSEIGLYYLPSGALVVMFDEYAGAVKTKRYIVNEVGGRKPLSNWTAPATVTADGTATHGAGRAMDQSWKFRVGS